MSLDFGDGGAETDGGGPVSTKTPPNNADGSKPRYKRQRQRKTGLSTVEAQRSLDSVAKAKSVAGTCAHGVQRRARKTDSNSTQATGSSGTGSSGGVTGGGGGGGSAGGGGGSGHGVNASKRSSASQSSLLNVLMDESNIYERCPTCQNVIERFSEEGKKYYNRLVFYQKVT